MKKLILLATALCANLELAGAQTTLVVRLDSAQQVPPNASTAIGAGTLTLNADSTLSYDISYSGLTADFLAAHIHGPAGPGTNGPVVVPLTNVATNNQSGALRGTSPALTAPQVADLTNGLFYANIHSADFPDGEIRGQVRVGGPFNSESWPPSIVPSKLAHFVSTDQAFLAPSATWTADSLQLLSGGDQDTAPTTIGGHSGLKTTGNYLNVADTLFAEGVSATFR